MECFVDPMNCREKKQVLLDKRTLGHRYCTSRHETLPREWIRHNIANAQVAPRCEVIVATESLTGLGARVSSLSPCL